MLTSEQIRLVFRTKDEITYVVNYYTDSNHQNYMIKDKGGAPHILSGKTKI